jgi:hypothetical protein
MGRVKKTEISKAPPLTEVKVLARPPYTNRSPEISLTLRRYWRDISSNDFM